MNFNQLGISAPILKALKEEAYETPTPIQEKTIPSGLDGHDILGLAQTGTGKTAAFAIPTLQRLSAGKQRTKKRRIRALILTPTRELALQIQESFTTYGRYLPLKSTVIFGGVKQGSQVAQLQMGVDILVATPGRFIDLTNQGYIDMTALEIFILDEADRMLDMGFIHDIRRIIKVLPLKKQTMLFSATMPKEIGPIIEKLLVNPVEVSVAPVSSTVDTIEQELYYVDKNNKIEVLTQLFQKKFTEPVLVFSRTKHGADKIVKLLGKRKIKAQAIHGNKSQNARQTALHDFKNGEIRALVATDIAARGIDINELKYVVNYDLPEVPETYVHRIGRTGRAGKEGLAISFCSFPEIPLLKDIEKLIKKHVQVMENKDFPMVDETIPEKKGNNQQRRRPAANTAPEKTRSKENRVRETGTRARETGVKETGTRVRVTETRIRDPRSKDTKARDLRSKEIRTKELRAKEARVKETKREPQAARKNRSKVRAHM